MDDQSTDTARFSRILHLTDFSPCSDHALQWAIGLARAHNSKLCVFHVVVPDVLTYMTPDSPAAALDLKENWAREEMQRLEGRLAGIPHETRISQGSNVWSVVDAEVQGLHSDLLVLGTHGRTGLGKLLLGSVAESVLRHSVVPVLSVRAEVQKGEKPGKFRRVLLASNFTAGSEETASYAVALAQRNDAQLLLLHACKAAARRNTNASPELSVAEALHRLHDLAPENNRLRYRPESIVEFGDAGTRILEVAKLRAPDLIVIGVQDAPSTLLTTHIATGTAHEVVAHAPCPVLTVRPRVLRAVA